MPIRAKVITIILLISILPIILLGSFIFNNAKEYLKDDILEGLNGLSEFKEGEVFLFIESFKNRTIDFASDGFIRSTTEAIFLHPNNSKSLTESLNKHLTKNKSSLDDSFLFIDILNLDGIIISSSKPQRKGINKSNKAYFREGKKRTYTADVHIENDGTLELEVSSPLFSMTKKDTVVGVLVNHFDLSSLNSLFTGETVLGLGAKTQLRGRGKTGETYLVNQDEFMITESLLKKDSPFKQKATTYPVKMCLESDKEVTGIWKNYLGVKVVGSSMCIEIDDFKWTLISEQNYDEAFSKIESLKAICILITAILIALIIFIAIFTANLLTQPFISLISAAKTIASGNFDINLSKHSNDSEIGLLSQEFNKMASKLKQMDELRSNHEKSIRKQRDYLDKAINSLSHPFYVIDANNYSIVLANTAAIDGTLKKDITCYALTHNSEKPCIGEHVCPLEIVKNTKKPTIVEHIHYDKQGNPRSVEVHGYPIFDEEGNVIQMIEYSLDITDRRQTEIELKNRNEELEKTNKLMIGRELKMIELKKKIEELKITANNNHSKNE